ncbi:MAG: TetR/AcrR family transcriptional regulator [Hyphomicrobiales bacterium]|nr:MAG: TetR/AcrR family transcriptional regulator [Hyphomicrobiales bacterium]
MTAPNSTVNVRKQPRQARSQATVAAILEAAARILETDGLPAFTTNAVAERAGVSIGSLYQYFPAREALLATLIRNKREGLLAALEEATHQPQSDDLSALVAALVRAGIAHWRRYPGLTRSLSYAEALLPMNTETLELKRRILTVIADALARHGMNNPAEAARDLAALTYGMTDATGAFGPSDPETLEARIVRAAIGYLGDDRDIGAA